MNIFTRITNLKQFRASRHGWPYKGIDYIAQALTSALEELNVIANPARRSEVISGGVVTAGTGTSASALKLSIAAVISRLNGKIKASNSLSDVDLFAVSGQVAQPVFVDGATAASIALATDETAYVAIIQADTDGAGGRVAGDNSASKFIAVVKGTAATYAAATAYPTRDEIKAALAASTGVHAGVGDGWTYLARVLWDENSASPTQTITMNRDNVLE